MREDRSWFDVKNSKISRLTAALSRFPHIASRPTLFTGFALCFLLGLRWFR
jgi:hypothetical protein